MGGVLLELPRTDVGYNKSTNRLGLAAIKWFMTAFETLNLLTYLLNRRDGVRSLPGLKSTIALRQAYSVGSTLSAVSRAINCRIVLSWLATSLSSSACSSDDTPPTPAAAVTNKCIVYIGIMHWSALYRYKGRLTGIAEVGGNSSHCQDKARLALGRRGGRGRVLYERERCAVVATCRPTQARQYNTTLRPL